MKLKSIRKNMTELTLNETVILFSYETPVAAFVPGTGYVKTSKKWSTTTSRHINEWLQGAQAETREQSYFDRLATI